MESSQVPMALGATQAGLGAYGAYAQNQEIGKVMGANARATAVNLDQLGDQADLERRKQAITASQIRGRLRVLAADSGFATSTPGTSFADLERSAILDDEINRAIIDRNFYNQQQREISQLDVALYQLRAGSMNPATSAISGGLSGYATGLQLEPYLRPDPSGEMV